MSEEKKKYVIYVDTRTDGYIAYCPGIGCEGHGITENEAVANLYVEIQYFEARQEQQKKNKQKQ